MKTLLIALTTGIALLISYGAVSAADQTQTARMEACFKAHGKLMPKPAVMNREACWRAHRHLMPD